MDYSAVMAALKARSNAKTLDVLRDQGAEGEALGVPMREIRQLAEELGRDSGLARQLWQSGVVDARILATQVVDPADLDEATLDGWVRDVRFYGLADHLTHLVVETPHAKALMDRWVESDQDFVQRCGFLLMAELAKHERELEDRELETKLETIEDHIRNSTTRAKEELGAALLTIGRRNDRLNDLALEVARQIGKIEIEHPELGTITSDAVELLKNPELARKLMEGKLSTPSDD